jgi:heat-inducible transcriptional repressor
VYTFDHALDQGLVDWAGQYLNEQVAGLKLGTRALRRRFEDEGLSARERSFLATLRPAFVEAVADEDQRVFVGGAASLLDDVRVGGIGPYRALLEVLEQRAVLLDILAATLDPRRLYVRLGDEIENPALRELSLVGATYGVSHRPLGAVSLVGPLRMDYDKAIRSVRSAAHELSRFVEAIYGEN